MIKRSSATQAGRRHWKRPNVAPQDLSKLSDTEARATNVSAHTIPRCRVAYGARRVPGGATRPVHCASWKLAANTDVARDRRRLRNSSATDRFVATQSILVNRAISLASLQRQSAPGLSEPHRDCSVQITHARSRLGPALEEVATTQRRPLVLKARADARLARFAETVCSCPCLPDVCSAVREYVVARDSDDDCDRRARRSCPDPR